MQRSEYDEWAGRHATTFGFAFEADVKMLLSWFDVLNEFSAAELHGATTEMSRSTSPERNLRDHLAAIQRNSRGKRAIAYSRGPSPDGLEMGSCLICGGSGRVVVPHLAGVQNGEWRPVKVARGGETYYTCAVLCGCRLGNWFREHIRATDRRRAAMTLESYGQRNPSWKVQMAQRSLRQTAQGRAARAFCQALDDVLNSLREQAREPGVDE